MANLFWKQKNKTANLLSKPFETEEEFERTVFETKELFEDITLIKRQIRGGHKSGIPDIIGIDANGAVCIIEMKNVAVNASIIPQVLSYAIWAESNPDSIKNLWLEKKEKEKEDFEEIEIDWEDYSVRILIIAPEIDPTTLNFRDKITYDIDLVEIKRWTDDKNSFLLVSPLVAKNVNKIKPVKGRPEYTQEYYNQYRNKKSVTEFFKYITETEKLLKSKGYQLEKKFNKHYCGFKYGFFNVFVIAWVGTKTFAFRFKLPESIVKKNPGNMKVDRNARNRQYYYITPGKTNVKSFWPLIQKALDNKSIEETTK